MIAALWIALAVTSTGLLWLVARLPELAALRDHEARAQAFAIGVRSGMSL